MSRLEQGRKSAECVTCPQDAINKQLGTTVLGMWLSRQGLPDILEALGLIISTAQMGTVSAYNLGIWGVQVGSSRSSEQPSEHENSLGSIRLCLRKGKNKTTTKTKPKKRIFFQSLDFYVGKLFLLEMCFLLFFSFGCFL